MIYIDTDIRPFDLQQALALCSQQRRSQALQKKREEDRRLCVMTYRLLCRALQAEYSIDGTPQLDYAAEGKPQLKDYPQIHFNWSHCRCGAVCGVSSAAIGVDAEAIRPYKDSLARYTLNETEYRRVAESHSPDKAFVRLWTQKEALLKMTGKGLRTDLKTVLTQEREQVEAALNEKTVLTSFEISDGRAIPLDHEAEYLLPQVKIVSRHTQEQPLIVSVCLPASVFPYPPHAL